MRDLNIREVDVYSGADIHADSANLIIKQTGKNYIHGMADSIDTAPLFYATK